jgi:hypothetical protein
MTERYVLGPEEIDTTQVAFVGGKGAPGGAFADRRHSRAERERRMLTAAMHLMLAEESRGSTLRVSPVDDPRLADYVRLTDMKLRTSLESAQGCSSRRGRR